MRFEKTMHPNRLMECLINETRSNEINLLLEASRKPKISNKTAKNNTNWT